MTYTFVRGNDKQIPILISAPHAGSELPASCKETMIPEILADLLDVDWHVDKLYDFAKELGISIIVPRYARYLVDLNRPRDNRPLYTDSRQQTGVVSTKDFSRNEIYKAGRKPTEKEIEQRLKDFYDPYHEKLENELEKLCQNHRKILLFEAHSIRRFVPEIKAEPFPDFTLSDFNQKSCENRLSKLALSTMKNLDMNCSYNTPFAGGYITRYYAERFQKVNCLQLEISQDMYLNNDRSFHQENFSKLKSQLKKLFETLILELRKGNS